MSITFSNKVSVPRLNDAAEVYIEEIIHIQPALTETIRNCVLKYSLPYPFSKKFALEWVPYRIWNAVKSIFGQSDWQKTIREASHHISEYLFSLPTYFKTQETQIAFKNLSDLKSPKLADLMLSSCLTVNNSWNNFRKEEARELFNPVHEEFKNLISKLGSPH